MKIAFLVPTIHGMGGTASAVATQANALCAEHDVEVLSVYRFVERPHYPLDPRVTVRDLVDLASAPPTAGPLSGDAVTALRDRPPLLIHPDWDPNVDALSDLGVEAVLPTVRADVLVTASPALTFLAAEFVPPEVAIVHQEHRSSSQRHSGMESLLAFAPRADVVAALTEPMAVWLAGELGERAPEIVVMPNALPPGFRPRSTLAEPVIVAAGRLVSEKQYSQLVSAFGLIADRIPEWRLRIFGEGKSRFDIAGAARKLGLWDRVELPGPTSDMTSEWARASIAALTSRTEGYPLVLQEAMAAGVPVVSYDCPSGPRAILDDGVDGLLVSPGSVPGLAAALLRLATDPAERSRLGQAGVTASARWDSQAVSAQWVEIFERALQRRAGVGRVRGRGTLRHRLSSGPGRPVLVDPVEGPPGGTPVGVTPEESRARALGAATQAAAAVCDEWFVVPPRGVAAVTVVVPMPARRAFLEALGALPPSDLPPYLGLHDPEDRGWPSRRGTVEEMVPTLVRGRTSLLLIEPWPRVDGSAALLGESSGIAVEFWEVGPDGALHPNARARYATSLPAGGATATTVVHGHEVPTYPLMAVPTVFECRFPVDVVYTWVDGNDEAWNDARERRLAEVGDPTMRTRASSGRARYVDRGELRYSMRSLHLFAPWVRRIHLVTAGQRPEWLDVDHPMINLVDHRDLLPEDALPTFNSHAIEAAVHGIDGLAEHFIYLNDDFLLGRPTTPERWFSPSGSTATFLSSGTIGLTDHHAPPYLLAADNNRRLLERDFGVVPTHTLLHAPYAHRRSVLSEIAERFPAEVEQTQRSPFRSGTDISMLSSLGQHYGMVTGRAHVGEVEYGFVDLSHVSVRRVLRGLLARDRDCFCLGDSHDYARPRALVDQLVSDFLETYVPIAAPWERR